MEPHAHRGIAPPLYALAPGKPAINPDNETTTGLRDHNTPVGHKHLKSLVLRPTPTRWARCPTVTGFSPGAACSVTGLVQPGNAHWLPDNENSRLVTGSDILFRFDDVTPTTLRTRYDSRTVLQAGRVCDRFVGNKIRWP